MKAKQSWQTFAIVTVLGALAVGLFYMKEQAAGAGVLALVSMVLAGSKAPIKDENGNGIDDRLEGEK